jgi:hypothetical protein
VEVRGLQPTLESPPLDRYRFGLQPGVEPDIDERLRALSERETESQQPLKDPNR